MIEQSLHLWLSQLPLTNLHKSSCLIYNALQNLKQLNVSTEERVIILQTFHPIVLRVTNELGNDQANHLSFVLIHHYLDFLKHADLPQIAMTELLEQAMSHCVHLLLSCAKIYKDVPKNFWSCVYQLYSIALKNEIMAIEKSMKAIVLLSVSQLYQLPSKQIAYLFESLISWDDKIIMHADRKSDYLIIFSLQENQPPCYQALATKEGHYYGIDTKPLVAHLSGLIQKKGVLHCDRYYTQATLRHLCRVWGAFSERALKRIARRDEVVVSVGLIATRDLMHCDPRALLHLIEGHDQIFSWTLLNSSEQGYCFMTSAEHATELKIGEIIGIQEKNKNTILVGTIRWLKHSDAQQLLIGVCVETVSPQLSLH